LAVSLLFFGPLLPFDANQAVATPDWVAEK